MHVCVINFSGNVGKTTVAAHLLKPRLKAKLFSVESLNHDAIGDGVDAERLRAQAFGAMRAQLLLEDNAVVDVGSSNVEAFLEMMRRYRDSFLDYDYFVVPTVKERKQSIDTVNTIDTLTRQGVAPERIRLIFNRVDPKEDFDEAFAPVLGFAAHAGLAVRRDACLYMNEVYELVKDHDMTLEEIIADATDHRALLRQEASPEAKAMRIRRLSMKGLATSADEDMTRVFAATFAATFATTSAPASEPTPAS